LVSAKFIINNKIYLATKILLFIANYRRELRMELDIRRKGKMKKAMDFVERMKEVQEKAKAIKIVKSKLSFLLVSFLIFILFSIYFHIFYF